MLILIVIVIGRTVAICIFKLVFIGDKSVLCCLILE